MPITDTEGEVDCEASEGVVAKLEGEFVLASESSTCGPLIVVVGIGATVGSELLSPAVGLIVSSSVLFMPLVGGGVIDKIGEGVSTNDGTSEVSSDKKLGPYEGELVDVGELVEGILEVVGLKDVVVAPVGL